MHEKATDEIDLIGRNKEQQIIMHSSKSINQSINFVFWITDKRSSPSWWSVQL